MKQEAHFCCYLGSKGASKTKDRNNAGHPGSSDGRFVELIVVFVIHACRTNPRDVERARFVFMKLAAVACKTRRHITT